MAEKERTYKTVPIWRKTWEKLKELSIKEEKPLTVLVDELVDFYIKHQTLKQRDHSSSK